MGFREVKGIYAEIREQEKAPVQPAPVVVEETKEPVVEETPVPNEEDVPVFVKNEPETVDSVEDVEKKSAKKVKHNVSSKDEVVKKPSSTKKTQ